MISMSRYNNLRLISNINKKKTWLYSKYINTGGKQHIKYIRRLEFIYFILGFFSKYIIIFKFLVFVAYKIYILY
jgi:hypothetical protein